MYPLSGALESSVYLDQIMHLISEYMVAQASR